MRYLGLRGQVAKNTMTSLFKIQLNIFHIQYFPVQDISSRTNSPDKFSLDIIMYLCINIYACMYTCVCVCMYVRRYAYMYVSMYVCICVCVMCM